MEQSKSNRSLGFWLGLIYLIGVICGCMMIKMQLSDAAGKAASLIGDVWEQLKAMECTVSNLVKFGCRLFLPGLILMIAIYISGLWMIGQPLVYILFGFSGIGCGCYGMWLLLEQQYLFAAVWYVPFAVCYFLLLLPAGIAGVQNCLKLRETEHLREKLVSCAAKNLGYLFLLLLLCVAAAVCYRWYGAMLFSA